MISFHASLRCILRAGVFGALLIALSGCSIRSYIGHGEYLLRKVKIKGEPAGYNETLYGLIKQKPNKRILGLYPYNMWTYLLANRQKVISKRQKKISDLDSSLAVLRMERDTLSPEEENKRLRLERQINRLDNKRQKQQEQLDDWLNAVEAPVIVDSSKLNASITQMNRFLFENGYFNNSIDYKIRYRRHKAKVNFEIKPGDLFYFRNYEYVIYDHRIDSLVRADTSRPLIRKGDAYKASTISAERERIDELLANKGFYYFRPQYVKPGVDSMNIEGDSVDVYDSILNPSDTSLHRVYRLGKIYIEPEYIFGDSIGKAEVLYGQYIFLSKSLKIRPEVLLDFVFLKEGEIYREVDRRNTLSRLGQLRNYQFVDIQFQEDTLVKGDTGSLLCYIRLTPLKKFSFTSDLELNRTEETDKAVTSSYNSLYGITGAVTVLDRNLDRRAMQFETRLRGAVQMPFDSINFLTPVWKLINYQVGLTNSLILPRIDKLWPYSIFLRPFQKISNGKKVGIFSPEFFRRRQSQTSFNLNLLYENNGYFKRTTASVNFTYQWKSVLTPKRKLFRWIGKSIPVTNFLTPLEIGLVNADTTSLFRASNDPLIQNLFDQHLITAARYYFMLNQQPFSIVKQKAWYFRFTFEVGGLLPYMIDNKYFNEKDTTGGAYTKKLFGITYYNYVKFEPDFRYYFPIGHGNNLATRLTIGLGLPILNSNILPFEKRYFLGGANSMRAWRTRGLGPGSFNPTTGTVDKSGDVKGEANFEYRFPVWDILKGALFTDIGNIWTTQKDPGGVRPGAKFSDQFMKELAVGAGVGVRFDFSFFVFRFDFAVPVRDPSYKEADRWVISTYNKDNLYNKINLNLGIGYPF